MSESDSILSPGMTLADRYKLTEEIGRGGFGMVYRARQLNMDRDVAIKILPPKFMSIPDVAERFRREARLASRLRHPNTITVHDYGSQENLLFIVMELLDGEDLADVLMRKSTMSMDRILHIGRQVLKSLHEAHSHKIIHRDLKPENIFLTDVGGEEDFVKVLDFGIAKLAMPEAPSGDGEQHRKLTVTGSTVGTPTYMSPEQAAGEEVDALTDLYALGVILYEMACGRPPFRDDNPVKVMRCHLFEELPRFPQGPLRDSRFEAIIRKALAKDKAHRFDSAREFLRALTASPTEMLERNLVQEESPTLEMPGSSDSQKDTNNLPFERTAAFDVEGSDEMSPRSPLDTDTMLAERTSSASDADESIPFEAVPESRDRVPEGAPSASNLTDASGLTDRSRQSSPSDLHSRSKSPAENPPAGFKTGDSSSSIITVLEPAAEDDVILLTNKKEERDANTTDASLTPQPAQNAPVERSGQPAESAGAQRPTPHPEPEPAASRSGDWSWGAGPGSHQAQDSDFDELMEFEGGGSARMVVWVVLLLLAATAAGAAYVHFSGTYPLF